MRFELFIARRYLFRGRKNSFISIISLVSILGIAIGVAALIVALSLINGFQSDIRDKILSSTAHIMVSDMVADGISGYDPVIRELRASYPEIRSAGPVVIGTVLLKGEGKNAAGAVMRGVDTTLLRQEEWPDKVTMGRLPEAASEAMIGQELADKLSVVCGDQLLVIVPQPRLSPSGLIPKFRKMAIVGVFESGVYEVDNTILITGLETAQKLFSLQGRITYIQIFLHDAFDAERLAERLRQDLPLRLSLVTWRELNASLYSALELEKTVLFFTLTLIIVVAALNIIAGLILLVIQKTRDIGILLSYGATPRIIKRIFFLQGGIIGAVGTLAGVVIGLGFCALANRFELIRVPAEIYQMSYVPFKIAPFDLLAVIAVSLLIGFTATWIPARKAAAVNVVEAVKNE